MIQKVSAWPNWDSSDMLNRRDLGGFRCRVAAAKVQRKGSGKFGRKRVQGCRDLGME